MKQLICLLSMCLAGSSLAFGQNEFFIETGAAVTIQQGVEITVQGDVTNEGTITGEGTLGGNVTNAASGVLSPGFSAGCQTYSGNLTNNGTIILELADGDACTDFDRITVNGDAIINGTIQIVFPGDVVPTIPNFDILNVFGSMVTAPTMEWPAGNAGNTTHINTGNPKIFRVVFPFLPVEFSFFSANIQDDKTVLLTWETASESSNAGFEVQRSRDGKHWQELGFVAGFGTSSTAQYYSFRDLDPANGWNYYRLLQMDFDGNTEYSEITRVNIDQGQNWAESIQIYPNPVSGNQVNILLPTNGTPTGEWSLFSPFGQLILEDKITSTTTSVDLSNFSAGTYLLRITQGNNSKVERILLQY